MSDLPFGLDFGEIPYTTCAICGEYIWEAEVDKGDAYFGAFDPHPPHHMRCLGDFVRTRTLLPQYMSYYQRPWEYEQSECGGSGALAVINREANERGQPIPKMAWKEVEQWLLAQAMIAGFMRPTNAMASDMDFLQSMGIKP